MLIGDSDDNSGEPLPDGWTVKVKVRPSGKKDKYYFPPSGESIFHSKLEVVRYLNNDSPKSEKKNGINLVSSQNVACENPEADGLPSGWTKEIKVTKKGRKIRRDPYYTDPVSGYVFRSMKDALRYVETGELGRLAFKPKDISSNDMELLDDEASSPAVAKKQKLDVNGTRSPNISDESSMLSEVANGKHVPSPPSTGEVGNDKLVPTAAGTGSTPVHEHTIGEQGSQSVKSGVQENKSSTQKVQRKDPDKSVIATAGRAISNERSLDSETKKDESKRTSPGKSLKKKDLSLPRRTSNRLSGLPLHPTPELKTTGRARRAAVKQSNDKASPGMGSSLPEFEGKHAFDASKSMKPSLELNKSKHPVVNLAAVGLVETENTGNEKPESASISRTGSQVETEKQSGQNFENAAVSDVAGQIQKNNVNDEKSGLYLDLPLGDLCQDPCIAFAIKTLTGISFDNTDTVQVSTGSNSDFGGLATSEDNTRKEDSQFRVRTQQGCTADQPLNNVVTGEQVEELEISKREDEKAGSAFNLSFADAWADPCIEFAIKTLTGAIPLDCDVVKQDRSQHKTSSSHSHESSGMSLQNGSEIGQSQIFCQQFGMPGRVLMEPGLRHNKNRNVGYSDGTNRVQHGGQRNKGSHR
ncbi:methyl-CPG-binding domain protein 13 [Euphorbia peplus]|nr:methyl-CPG-binding domain protein 13 [Euphorbia peplus]